MRELLSALVLVPLAGIALAACHGTEAPATPALTAPPRPEPPLAAPPRPAPPLPEPPRPGIGRVPDAPVAECPRERAAGLASGMGRTLCRTDADCTAGRNGRCLESSIHGERVAACSYDQCFVDADCPERHACLCGRRDAEASGAHACSPNQCATDADCGPDRYCRRSEWGQHCQSLHDECVIGQRCGPGEACIHDQAAGIQRCQVPPPPPPG